MDTIFKKSGNSKTSDPHKLEPTSADKVDLKKKNKYALSLKLVSTIHGKKVKKPHKSNKFKISASTWNDEFELTG